MPSVSVVWSMSAFLTVFATILYVLSSAGILCLLISYFLQLRRHCELVPAGRAAEERLLATPLPDREGLPHVVVQIVSYNEGGLARRALQAAALLDWPKDRLHVQLLDDSTDDTLVIGRTTAAELRGSGFDVVVLHRDRR